jgi:hypothetical protein
MGRARSQQTAVAVGSFNSILGARRGSVGAQAQRDAGEDVEREAVFRQFRNALSGSFPTPTAGHSTLLLGNKLVNKYRQHLPASEVADGLMEFVQSAGAFDRGKVLENFATVVAAGDPMFCPGLTEPALLALCNYFAEVPEDESRDKELIESELSSQNLHAERVIKTLFGDGNKPAFYVRTQQLCETIGKMLARPVRSQSLHSGLLGEAAARALFAAPEEALAGPLQGWINAFAQRSDQESLTHPERKILGELILSYEAGSVGGDALAGLVLRGI